MSPRQFECGMNSSCRAASIHSHTPPDQEDDLGQVCQCAWWFHSPRVRPNPSLNRTRNGMPPSGLISFWPCGVLPLRAG